MLYLPYHAIIIGDWADQRLMIWNGYSEYSLFYYGSYRTAALPV